MKNYLKYYWVPCCFLPGLVNAIYIKSWLEVAYMLLVISFCVIACYSRKWVHEVRSMCDQLLEHKERTHANTREMLEMWRDGVYRYEETLNSLIGKINKIELAPAEKAKE